MKPTEPEAYQDFVKHNWRTPDYYCDFNSFVYSFETFVPLLDLGLEKKWSPNPHQTPSYRGRLIGEGLVWYRRIHLLFGYFFVTMFGIGLSGLVRKE